MIIRVLVENTSDRSDLSCEHGLSLFIKSGRHSILFDMGASDLFSKNASRLGIDLSQVDIAILSHGHYDHSGGLKTFLQLNSGAKVYLHEKAPEPHYGDRANGKKAYIGMDLSLLPNERFVFCRDRLTLDEELELFSNVKGSRFLPAGNHSLLKKIGDDYVPDDFAHEQNLVVRQGDKTLLVAGCAHTGIVNILEHFHGEKGYFPDYVIGGFHLFNPSTKENEPPAIVAEIGAFLLSTKAKFLTCHCTGIDSYLYLKSVMGDAIDYISTGDQLDIS